MFIISDCHIMLRFLGGNRLDFSLVISKDDHETSWWILGYSLARSKCRKGWEGYQLAVNGLQYSYYYCQK